VNLYSGNFRTTLTNTYNLSITTNATLKMYEMLTQFDLIDFSNPIRCFCNAELPGAFIVAINHYVNTMHFDNTVDFDWLASSYYPAAAENTGNTTILDDAYGIYAKNREHWLMGPNDNSSDIMLTGDLMKSESIILLSDRVKRKFNNGDGENPGCNLYTADAGIDVSEDYNLDNVFAVYFRWLLAVIS
jgi:cap2 methyltransferase